MRKFNVYSPLIVVYPGEQFEWELNAAEGASVVVQPPTGGSWPLTANQYTVTAGTPLPATVNSDPASGESAFTCTPPAPNIAAQQIVVANGPMIDVCSDVNVNRGEYFIWKNDTTAAATITPDAGNNDFWPLAAQSHGVPANGWSAVQIPSSADPNKEYLLNVTFAGGGGCPQQTQPKLKVSAPSAH